MHFSRLIGVCTLLLGIAAAAGDACSDTYVRGYHRKDGTYVKPHYRSDRDGDFSNNWSTRGNVNPYTGKLGTKESAGRRGETSWGGSYATTQSLPQELGAPYIAAMASVATSPKLPDASGQQGSKRGQVQASGMTIEEMIQTLEKTDRTLRLQVAKQYAAIEPAVSWTDLAMRMHVADLLTLRGQHVSWRDYRALSDLMDLLTGAEGK